MRIDNRKFAGGADSVDLAQNIVLEVKECSEDPAVILQEIIATAKINRSQYISGLLERHLVVLAPELNRDSTKAIDIARTGNGACITCDNAGCALDGAGIGYGSSGRVDGGSAGAR